MGATTSRFGKLLRGSKGSRSAAFAVLHAALGGALLVGTLALVGGTTACDDKEEFFHSCPLSQTLIDACAENDPNAEITCAVKAHPMCDEGVCAKWDGSDSFCSRVCTADANCPAASHCEPYLDYSFCVPDDVLSATVAQ